MVDWTALREEFLPEADSIGLPPAVKLPILPAALTKFLQLANAPEVTFQELGEVISTDAGLTCELLKYVNSAGLGLRVKAQTPAQAIKVLGIRTARLLLASWGLERVGVSRKSKLLNIRNFSNSNLERALFAREVAGLLHVEQDLAYAGGLLQDYLLPVLTNELYEQYLDFQHRSDTGVSLSALERKRFGWDHAEAGARLMLAWGFPDDLICCVLFHHAGVHALTDARLNGTAVAAVAVAGLMPDSFQQVPRGLDRLVELSESWPEFDLLEAARRVHEQLQQLGTDLRNYIDFYHRCEKVLQRS